MMWSEETDDHVFVFWNGVLIFKTWRRGPNAGLSAVFDLHGLNWRYVEEEGK